LQRKRQQHTGADAGAGLRGDQAGAEDLLPLSTFYISGALTSVHRRYPEQ
jgi:hypothetical protein